MANLPPAPAAAEFEEDRGWPQVKVTKTGATYVFRLGTDYRCVDCWKWLPNVTGCMEMPGANGLVTENHYCTYWSPRGGFTPEELGLSDDPNGTQCHRCIYKNPGDDKYCHRVDESTPGDTPGQIHPNACCAHQEPRE
jgi:hypothetical protein